MSLVGRILTILFVLVAFMVGVMSGTVSYAEKNDTLSPNLVGFIWHYPFSDVGTDQIAASGANVLMSRLNWLTVQPNEMTFDFSSIKKQIQAAEKAGVKLVLLLEFNPFCAPEWLKEKCKTAGEGTLGFDGRAGTMPQTTSPLFREAQTLLVTKLTEFLRINDISGTVTHYMPGIEWWFPPSEQYSKTDLDHFRNWLQQKYRSIHRLNDAWGGHYASFTDVKAPGVAYQALYEKERQGLDHVSFNWSSTTGIDISPTSLIAVSEDWTAYWNETSANYINSLGRLVKGIDPTRPRASYLTFAWAQTAEWDYVNWSQIRLDSAIEAAKDLDIIGMQLCFTNGDSYRLTAGLDTARKYGKPMWDMDLLDFVTGVKSGFDAYEKNTHAAIQHGASGLFYCNWNGAKDYNLYPDWPIEQINRMVTDARKALDLVQGTSLVIDGAIVNPIVSCAPKDPVFGRNDVRSLMGWYKIVERLPKTIDVVTLREIENRWADLRKYRWILVPDSPYLSDIALHKLSNYVRKGGVLIQGGRFAMYDEKGNQRKKFRPFGQEVSDYGLEYAGADFPRRVFAGDVPPEMIWRVETDEKRAILKQAQQTLRDAFMNKISVDTIQILPAQQDVSCAIRQGNGFKLIYLVNRGSEMVKDVRLVIENKTFDIAQVYTDLKETAFSKNNPETLLPEFRTSCIVHITED